MYFRSRFLQKHPEHKAMHKSLAKFDDDEKMRESNAFEMAAMGVYCLIVSALFLILMPRMMARQAAD